MRVVLADDAALFRQGLGRLLAERDHTVVGEAGDAQQLLEHVAAQQPDVAIIDIRMPPDHVDEGLVAALAIRERHPRVGVVVLSQYLETHHAVRLLAESPRGVGYLLKDRVGDIAELEDALARVAAGGSAIDPEIVAGLLRRAREHDPLAELTTREREVLAMMAEGYSNQAIGERFVLSKRTVESHVHSIFLKLGLPPGPAEDRRVLAVLRYLQT
jgi:DNA-binding NarL/FixJ family response regulator